MREDKINKSNKFLREISKNAKIVSSITSLVLLWLIAFFVRSRILLFLMAVKVFFIGIDPVRKKYRKYHIKFRLSKRENRHFRRILLLSL
jgi:predicted membrane protein